LGEDEEGENVEATHFAGPPAGRRKIAGLPDIKLPSDYLEFLSKWSWAILVLRECYWIRSLSEALKYNRDFRKGYKGLTDDDSWDIFRFADIWGGDFQNFAFRRKRDGSGWEVMCLRNEFVFLEADRTYCEPDWDHWVTDASFSDWLKRMCETDGIPQYTNGGNEEEFATSWRIRKRRK